MRTMSKYLAPAGVSMTSATIILDFFNVALPLGAAAVLMVLGTTLIAVAAIVSVVQWVKADGPQSLKTFLAEELDLLRFRIKVAPLSASVAVFAIVLVAVMGYAETARLDACSPLELALSEGRISASDFVSAGCSINVARELLHQRVASR
ncbi:MAG: hypothetical protein HQL38_01535 [Alphaproteobacteria bacterium]|nr:hypothetical protein [Alphaproteobacteria bacterium]